MKRFLKAVRIIILLIAALCCSFFFVNAVALAFVYSDMSSAALPAVASIFSLIVFIFVQRLPYVVGPRS